MMSSTTPDITTADLDEVSPERFQLVAGNAIRLANRWLGWLQTEQQKRNNPTEEKEKDKKKKEEEAGAA